MAKRHDLALAGLGIAYLFEPLVERDLAAGRLVEILSEAAITEPGLFPDVPLRAAAASKLRAPIGGVPRPARPHRPTSEPGRTLNAAATTRVGLATAPRIPAFARAFPARIP